jgi:hypothetical protein
MIKRLMLQQNLDAITNVNLDHPPAPLCSRRMASPQDLRKQLCTSILFVIFTL